MNQTKSQSKLLKILVIDDHEAIISGTIDAISRQYPEASIVQAGTAKSALEQINSQSIDLAITDLSIPAKTGDKPQPDIGIQLLRTLMAQYPTLNIVVQSADARALIRLRPNMYEHEGGFTVVDKGEPLQQMLNKVDWSLQGLIFTPKEMRTGLEVKEEWLTLLELAFNDCLKDKEISKRMNIAERTVRNYWTKIQDLLEIYPEDDKNMRIQTENRAREVGLID